MLHFVHKPVAFFTRPMINDVKDINRHRRQPASPHVMAANQFILAIVFLALKDRYNCKLPNGCWFFYSETKLVAYFFPCKMSLDVGGLL